MNSVSVALFDTSNFHVADVTVALVAGTYPGAVRYEGRTYVLQYGRYVRADVVDAEAASEAAAAPGE